MIVAVVETAAAMPPMMFRQSEHAVDRAHRAADTRADGSTDHCADGAGIALPLFTFNLGVELGQISIAALVLPIVWQLRKNDGFVRRANTAKTIRQTNKRSSHREVLDLLHCRYLPGNPSASNPGSRYFRLSRLSRGELRKIA